jgi:hypothetical protein
MSEHEKLRTFIEAVSGRSVPDATFDALTRILDQKSSSETDEEFRKRILSTWGSRHMISHPFAPCPVKLFVSPAVWAELKEADQAETARSDSTSSTGSAAFDVLSKYLPEYEWPRIQGHVVSVIVLDELGSEKIASTLLPPDVR